VEGGGAGLVSFRDDGALAPPEAGPVFGGLRARRGAVRLDGTFRWDPRRAIVMGELMLGGKDAENAVDALVEDGCATAAGDRRRAVADIARAWSEDGSWNRMAVAWSRGDADALNAAIRRELDRRDPSRLRHGAGGGGSPGDLRPGDRIRLTGWTPRESGVPEARRLRAGELAEYNGRDRRGRATFTVRGRDGAMRDVTLPEGTQIPEWRFGFAGTIAGEAGRGADSVHMLVTPGMNRQLLATGARLHRERLRMVATVGDDGLRRALHRIVARDATPESVLDHGFDPALGAREAMRGQSVEIAPESAPIRPGGVSAAVARLREIARLGDTAPAEAAPRGLEGEVMAEVIGASILRHGAAPEGRDRLALESHVAALADPRGWRRMLGQSPAGTVREADALALELAGTVPGDPSGRAPTAARILARGALTARAMGEGTVAELFEDGLSLYGRRASLARALGRPEDLVAAPAEEDARENPGASDREGRGGPDPARNVRRSGPGGNRPGHRPRSRGRARGLDLSRLLDGLETSDERLAEDAFGIFVPKGRKRRPARPRPGNVRRCIAELRLGGDWPERAGAVKAAREAMAAAARSAATPVIAETGGPARANGARGREAGIGDLALGLAMAVTTGTRMGSPVHDLDLRGDIAALLERTAAGAGDRVAALAGLEAGTEAERGLLRAVTEAAASGPLPETDALHDARSDILRELAVGGPGEPEPGEPPSDLGERVTGCFTRTEILALHDPRLPWPPDLPGVDGGTRRMIAGRLRAFAETGAEARGHGDDPLALTVALLARPEARETVADLARSLSLDRIRALRDPDGTASGTPAGLGPDGRERIAAAFRSAPVPGRRDTAPDPRLADDTLVLSCAVSERVDASSPVHRASLPRDIEDVLASSERAGDVPEAEVDEVASGIARVRAETDLRVAVTREVSAGGIFETRARFGGNPRYSARRDIDAYRAAVAKGMRRLYREEPLPTALETRVARAVVATHGTARHGLALAMAEALERGTPATADGIRAERAAVLAELRDAPERMETARRRSLLRRLYRSFTAADIRRIREGRGAVLRSLSDGAARERVAEAVRGLHLGPGVPEPVPWRGLHDALARSLGAERGHAPERGPVAEMGM